MAAVPRAGEAASPARRLPHRGGRGPRSYVSTTSWSQPEKGGLSPRHWRHGDRCRLRDPESTVSVSQHHARPQGKPAEPRDCWCDNVHGAGATPAGNGLPPKPCSPNAASVCQPGHGRLWGKEPGVSAKGESGTMGTESPVKGLGGKSKLGLRPAGLRQGSSMRTVPWVLTRVGLTSHRVWDRAGTRKHS